MKKCVAQPDTFYSTILPAITFLFSLKQTNATMENEINYVRNRPNRSGLERKQISSSTCVHRNH